MSEGEPQMPAEMGERASTAAVIVDVKRKDRRVGFVKSMARNAARWWTHDRRRYKDELEAGVCVCACAL